VVDGDGLTNTISYVTNNPYSANLISQVVVPFNRTASFTYDSQGRLTNITDVAGLSSGFVREFSTIYDTIIDLFRLPGRAPLRCQMSRLHN
jgi:YD repeat-containing protein